MANLYDILSGAQGGTAMATLGRELGLTPQQTEAAVAALLPAISTGLKRSTAAPEGLGNLFSVMARQQDLRAMYDDPDAAFADKGRIAGNDILSVIFGSPDVSRAVAAQAQHVSGVEPSVLKKLLPVLAGILISGMMGGKSGSAAPSTPAESTGGTGSLWDILGQIFTQGSPGPTGSLPAPTPPQQAPAPTGQPLPAPVDAGGQTIPAGGLLEQILRELQKGLQEGRIKPVIVEIPMPDGQTIPMPTGSEYPRDEIPRAPQIPSPSPAGGEILPGPKTVPMPQAPGGDILGQILRDLLGGTSGQTPRVPQSLGAAVFGERLEPGRAVDQKQLNEVQRLFDQLSSVG
jgi:hypothetical protein